MKEGWKYMKLGEVCEKVSNIKWSDVQEDTFYKYIDLSSVDRNDFSITAPQTIDKNNAPSRAKQIVKYGDVVFATTRPTLRRVCKINDDYNGQICSTGFCVLRPKKDVITDWIFYNLVYDGFYKYIEPFQTGASYPAVTDGSVKSFSIPVPPLSEQQRIVSFLDAGFAKIEAIKANAANQLQAAKDMFQAALTELLTPKEGWVEKKLGEVADIKGGKRVPKGYKFETTPTAHIYIRVADFNNEGSISLDDLQYINNDVYEQIKRYTITSDDVYISIAGTIGKSGIIPKELNGANLTENACKLVLKGQVCKEFIYFTTLSPDFKAQINKMTKVSSQPKLALTRLEQVDISFPKNVSEQQQIAAQLDNLSAKIKALQSNYDQTITLCNDLKQALLKQVFEEDCAKSPNRFAPKVKIKTRQK